MFDVLQTHIIEPSRDWLTKCQYRLCTSVDEFRDYALSGEGRLGADYETNSLNLFDGKLKVAGISVSNAEGSGLYVPVGHVAGYEKNLPKRAVYDVLQEADRRRGTVWYNNKYDGRVSRLQEIEVLDWRDAMLDVWLVDNHQKQLGLKDTVLRVYGIQMIEYAEVTAGRSFDQLDPDEAVPYACPDADFTRRLHYHPQMQAAVARQAFIEQIERGMTSVLIESLPAGVYLDDAHLALVADELGDDTRGKIGQVLQETFALLGGEINLRSGKQLQERFESLGIEIMERTPTGKMSTAAEVLAKYKHIPACAKITQWRQLVALKENYVDKMRGYVRLYGTHAHFAFNAMGAPTGRMSSGGEGNSLEEAGAKGYVNLNAQSIPDPGKRPDAPNLRKAIRACDVGRDDWFIISCDYSQIEMRVAGNLSRERMWIDNYLQGGDIHCTNARLAYADPTITTEAYKAGDDRVKRLRSAGKTMGFAVLFGATEETVAEHGGISTEQAAQLIETFYKNVPSLSAWMDATKREALANGFVTTAFGRERRFHEQLTQLRRAKGGRKMAIQSSIEREAVNTKVQGTAADIFKIACIKIAKLIHERKWSDVLYQCMWVHDEVVLRCHRSIAAEAVPAVLETMSFPVRGWEIPLVAEAECGWSWGELQEWKAFTSSLS